MIVKMIYFQNWTSIDGWVGSSSGTLVVRGLVSLVRLPPGTINVTAILVSGGGDHDLESATKACSNPYGD